MKTIIALILLAALPAAAQFKDGTNGTPFTALTDLPTNSWLVVNSSGVLKNLADTNALPFLNAVTPDPFATSSNLVSATNLLGGRLLDTNTALVSLIGTEVTSATNTLRAALEAAYAAADAAASNALVLQIAAKQHGSAALTNLSNGNGGALTNINAIISVLFQNGATNITVTYSTNGTTGFVTATFDLSRTGTGMLVSSNAPTLNDLTASGLVSVSTKLRVGSLSSTIGSLQLQPGGAATGYLEWWKSGGPTRLGFMGLSTTDVPLYLENNARFIVTGGNGTISGSWTSTNGFIRINTSTFPTNSVPSGTNTLDLVYKNIPYTVTTNPAAAGSFLYLNTFNRTWEAFVPTNPPTVLSSIETGAWTNAVFSARVPYAVIDGVTNYMNLTTNAP